MRLPDLRWKHCSRTIHSCVPCRYDAFETVMEILRMQQMYPGTPPQNYTALDRRFASFVACGYESIEDMGRRMRVGLGSAAAAALGGDDPAAGSISPDGDILNAGGWLGGLSASDGSSSSSSSSGGGGGSGGSSSSVGAGGARGDVSTQGVVDKAWAPAGQKLCTQSYFDTDNTCFSCPAPLFLPEGSGPGGDTEASRLLYQMYSPGGRTCCYAKSLADCPRPWA